MQINNFSNTHNRSFGIGIYNTKGLKSLGEYYTSRSTTEKCFNKYLDSIRDLGGDNTSLRVLKIFKDKEGHDKIEYVLSGQIKATESSKTYYCRLKETSSTKMKVFKDNLQKGINKLQEKADRFDKAEKIIAEEVIENSNSSNLKTKIIQFIKNLFK